MVIQQKIEQFLQNAKIYDSALLSFSGVDGFDVYNPSIPFEVDGKEYLFGRVERRLKWANSRTILFERVSGDHWRMAPEALGYPLEDPFISFIQGEVLLGGTHVRYQAGDIDTYHCYFYRGNQPKELDPFTCGPNYMKDIRLVDLGSRGIGVFSRPRSKAVLARYGTESVVGFRVISSLEELTAARIRNAPIISGLFQAGEWGGCNQALALDSGLIGCIGHQCFLKAKDEPVYVNTAFVLDPDSRRVLDSKVIGCRSCYPEGDAKLATLKDVAFTSGIVPAGDGLVNLYSGLGDCMAGRITIENPFSEYGNIIWAEAKN